MSVAVDAEATGAMAGGAISVGAVMAVGGGAAWRATGSAAVLAPWPGTWVSATYASAGTSAASGVGDSAAPDSVTAGACAAGSGVMSVAAAAAGSADSLAVVAAGQSICRATPPMTTIATNAAAAPPSQRQSSPRQVPSASAGCRARGEGEIVREACPLSSGHSSCSRRLTDAGRCDLRGSSARHSTCHCDAVMPSGRVSGGRVASPVASCAWGKWPASSRNANTAAL